MTTVRRGEVWKRSATPPIAVMTWRKVIETWAETRFWRVAQSVPSREMSSPVREASKKPISWERRLA
jgi:hypothetical protein